MKKKRLFYLVFNLLFVVCVIHLYSCSKEVSNPELSISGNSLVRSTSDAVMKFKVVLTKPSSGEVSVDYSTSDGKAAASVDYVPASGTLTIPADKNEAYIEIMIKGDNKRQADLDFNVTLSNPKSCTIAAASATGIIINKDGTELTTSNSGYITPATYPGLTLTWSDEFSGSELDLSSWNEELGNGSGGWGNNELEYYTASPKNVFISNGNLIIEARRETIDKYDYTSSRLTTQGKRYFKFGRIDIRAKLPVTKGIWPALWMLGTNINSAGWPACGEIDIMELVGTYPSRVTGTMHWKPLSGASVHKGADYSLMTGNFSDEFHVFSIIWKQDTITWLVDDQVYLTTSITDVGDANYPFNADQFFIFNVAVGGNWPGSPDYSSVFPQRMFVDYVRIFQ
jgi:beta-glucanase (GH16 family)